MTVTLLFLMMLSWADKAILGIAAVPLMKDLGIGPEQFGLVSSAMFLTFGVSQFVLAPLTNKVATRWILLVLCVSWSIAQLPILLFATLPALWVSRLLLGAGEGPLAPVMMHGVYKWFPAKKGATPAALASSGVTLGIVAFAPVMAWIVSHHGWRSAFLFVAVIGLVWAGFWLWVGKEGPYTSLEAERAIDGPDADPAAAESDTKAVEVEVPFWRTVANPTWVLAILVSFMGYWTFALATSWGPAYFEKVVGLSGLVAGSFMAVPAAWGALCTIGLSALTQRLDLRGVPTRKARGWVLGGAAVFAGANLLGATFTASTPVLSLVMLSLGFGTAPALFAITYLIVAELTTVSRRGSHLSVANAVFTTGGVAAPTVAGFFVGRAATQVDGYQSAFRLTAVLLLVIGALALVFINQQRERRRLGLDVTITAQTDSAADSERALVPSDN